MADRFAIWILFDPRAPPAVGPNRVLRVVKKFVDTPVCVEPDWAILRL